MDAAIHTFDALGTTCTVVVTDPAAGADALASVHEELAACDRACSRFRPDSDLSRLNAGAGRWVGISARLLDDLDAAVRAAEVTDGLVDPTVGGALVSLGYDRDFALVGIDGPDTTPVAPLLHLAPVPGWQALRLDRTRLRARVPHGVLVDLGATAKARAADRAARAAAALAGCGVLVGLGGDLAWTGAAPAGGWRIRVTDDASDHLHAPGQTVRLTTGALATSSVTVRRWSRRDVPQHHLIDPRTGAPASVFWRTASVTAATCLDANIASSAAIVLGVDAPAWLEARGLCARLVDVAGSVTTVGGWPPERPDRSPVGSAPVGSGRPARSCPTGSAR